MFNYFIIAALVATLLVLATGIFVMSRGGEFNRKYGNRLMRLRVVLQAVVILLIMAGLWYQS